jgi:hypothetical protein
MRWPQTRRAATVTVSDWGAPEGAGSENPNRDMGCCELTIPQLPLHAQENDEDLDSGGITKRMVLWIRKSACVMN